jgi:uncharacterized phage protein gp47/JayE
VIREPALELDSRAEHEVVQQVLRARAGFVPEWQAVDRSPGSAVARILARYLSAVIQRLNQAPAKAKLAFLDTVGVRLIPAQAARAPLVFVMAKDAAPGRITAGAAAAAPAAPGRQDPTTFETERAIGAMTGRITQLFSLRPGRDEYIDHSEKFLAGQPVRLFARPDLERVEHDIYIAHDPLLALSGEVDLRLHFELHQPSSEHLSVRWQFWNGTVWRDFLDIKPACRAGSAPTLDSTEGFQSSGQIQLIVSGADAKPREVFGVKSFWVRGRLDEALPPDPSATLPEIDSIRISSSVASPLVFTIEFAGLRGDIRPSSVAFVHLTNVAGEPLSGATVVAEDASGGVRTPFPPLMAGSEVVPGLYSAAGFDFAPAYRFRVELNDQIGRIANAVQLSSTTPIADLVLTVEGLEPDKAFADSEKLDVSKPFFPLGLQPQPGATFYVSNDEVLSKPGAAVRLFFAKTQSPLDAANIDAESSGVEVSATGSARTPLEHVLSWEYWNSRQWVPFMRSSLGLRDFTRTEIIDFTVPLDLAKTTVNDTEAYWLRAKLVRGGYGFHTTVTWLDGVSRTTTNSFTYVIQQPPCLAAIRLGYSWQYGPFHPDATITFNDFHYENRSDAARWPGNPFPPFSRVTDVTPTVYIGLDAKPPVDLIGFYFDIEEERGALRGPALRWEFFDGLGWRFLSVEDETERLRAGGIVSMLAPPSMKAGPRFGQPLYWFRARLKEDGPPGEVTVRGIFPNAVWASQRRTIRNTALGTSDGGPHQVYRVAEAPVLPGEILEVREVAGPRANVEWRQLALEVVGAEPRALAAFEEWLAFEGTETDFTRGDVRIRRDKNKRVSEVWIRWRVQPHLYFSTSADRHYAIDRAEGRLLFGDGELGRIPPLGAAVLLREFAAGGGSFGNVRAGAIDQLIAEVPGAEKVFNARAAEGGADGETLEAFATRGPETIRHRGRAIAPRDYETMAREASPAVAFVRAVPARNPAGRTLPGWVTLVVIPRGDEPRPMPSAGLRRAIREYIAERAPADLAGARRILVIGPDYFAVDVTATLAPAAAASAGDVEQRARDAVARFLHPLHGGPRGRGWDLGRDIFLSDLAAVLEQVAGVDYVEELALLRQGVPFGERVPIAEDRIAVAGTITLTLRTENG